MKKITLIKKGKYRKTKSPILIISKIKRFIPPFINPPVSTPIRPMIQCFATIRKKTNDKGTQASFHSERQKYCCSKRERCLGELTSIFKHKSAKRLLKVSFNKNNETFSPLNTTIKQQHNLFDLIQKVQKQLYK